MTLRQFLEQQQAQGLYRTRRLVQSPQQPEMRVDGQRVISFCSNDYLGLANHPEVRRSFQQASERYGVGSGAAHLVNGHSLAHHRLEAALAEFTGYPRALLFSTGYMANLGVTQALLQRGDTVFADRLNHASLLDGARLSGARLWRYRHNDTESLAGYLERSEATKRLIMTDGVFSMEGDLALLPELVALAKQHDAWLMVDDAHGFGVLGPQGKGSLAHYGIAPADLPIYMATLGKALGTAGAFVAGSETLIEYLIQTARSYIYTTASPPAIAAATLKSLEIVQAEPERRAQLQTLIQQFRSNALDLDLPLLTSSTAIQGILVGDSPTAVKLSEQLLAAGLLVTAIRPPTVPKGTARLRITLSAAHTAQHIDRLIDALAKNRSLLKKQA